MAEIKEVIFPDTGEMTEVVILQEGDEIRSKEQIEGLKKLQIKTEERRNFVEKVDNFIFRSMDGLDDSITSSDIVRLMYIATFVSYTGELRTENGAYIDKSIMKKYITLSRGNFNKWYNKMVEHCIFIEKENKILLDEKYYIKGSITSTKDDRYTRVFITAMRNLYESNQGKEITSLGNIFRLIPYMNQNYNIVCWNPTASKDIEIILLKDVLKLVNMDSKNIKKGLKSLTQYKVKNKPLFKFITDHINYENDIVIINPALFYGGDMNEYNQAINAYNTGKIPIVGK